jgi:hypothetical protein
MYDLGRAEESVDSGRFSTNKEAQEMSFEKNFLVVGDDDLSSRLLLAEEEGVSRSLLG